MECKGSILSISRDLDTGGIVANLLLKDVSVQELQTVRALEELSIAFKRYRRKRSLDANAYCWVLCSRIAEKVGSSKDEVYEQMLQDYEKTAQRHTGQPRYLPRDREPQRGSAPHLPRSREKEAVREIRLFGGAGTKIP